MLAEVWFYNDKKYYLVAEFREETLYKRVIPFLKTTAGKKRMKYRIVHKREIELESKL
ncbi:MAG: hypothetical protein Unbinned6486contig1001_32 [Prokaryotic dsDNA virus sp.]|nr:MAG: hypothetical protein Unbinned6486contig1001_32 [Prokaryotic dsDNA virus sp.]|tara:strand:+ start:7736 stop:7909 length:174 start_codon:yes stop_codon:yes gene_type:complete